MQLINGDRSRICLVIGLLYVIATIHCAGRVTFLSSELNHAADVANRIATTGSNKEISVKDGCLNIGNAEVLPACVITNHLVDLVDARAENSDVDAGQEKSNLIEALAERLKGAHELGWFVVDILLKLGLVGTIIGFILMLGSIANTASLDVNTMQKVLALSRQGLSTRNFRNYNISGAKREILSIGVVVQIAVGAFVINSYLLGGFSIVEDNHFL